VATGIQQTGLVVGVVPEIEEREAAIFCGYTWKEWLEFSLTEPEGRYNRASGIAHYRLHFMIEAHRDDAINDAMDAKSRGGR
jgi:hypothetical protein